MGRNLDTKNRIIELLSTKRMTLTDLCRQLELAPSTMNQHLKELLNMHAIRLVNNPYATKWKYYEIDPAFRGFEAPPQEPPMPARTQDVKQKYPASNVVVANNVFRIVGAVAVLAVVGAALFALYGTQGATPSYVSAEQYIAPGSVAPAGSTVFSISDAPGNAELNALNITVSSITARSAHGKSYLVFNGSKTLDLVQLQNISEIITGADLPNGTYNLVVLKISNATAILNGNETSVFVPGNVIALPVILNISNQSANWVDVDVNLSASVHMTKEGNLIFLPAISLYKFHASSFPINGNYTTLNITPDSQYRFWMGVNGTMAGNSPFSGFFTQFQFGPHGLMAMQNASAQPVNISIWQGRLPPGMLNQTSAAPFPYNAPAGQFNITARYQYGTAGAAAAGKMFSGIASFFTGRR